MVSNSIAFLDQYQRIWREPYERPHLMRVMAKKVDLEKEPIRFDEEIFVTKLILQISMVHRAIRHGELMGYEGLPQEVREFFPLPIPKIVWEKIKKFQDREFIEFIERALK
jgi:hypothetical protein